MKIFTIILCALGALRLQAADVSPLLAPLPESAELEACKDQLRAPVHKKAIEHGKEALKTLYRLGGKTPIITAQSSLTKLSCLGAAKELTEVERYLHTKGYQKYFAKDIMWALYDIAAERKLYFTEGTFVLEDKNLALFNYLTSIQETYLRSSSHFKKYNTRHYGLDLAGLPCNKRTILFGHLNGNLIFIKPENFGTKNISDTIEHGKEYIIAQARKIEFLRNLFNLASDQDPEFKKERIPANLIQRFSALIKKLEPDTQTQALHINSVNDYGIQKIAQILKAYITNFPKLQPILHEPELNVSGSWVMISKADIDEMRDLLNETVDFLEELATEDNIALRSGYEIIITQVDIKRALRLTNKPQQEHPEESEVD